MLRIEQPVAKHQFNLKNFLLSKKSLAPSLSKGTITQQNSKENIEFDDSMQISNIGNSSCILSYIKSLFYIATKRKSELRNSIYENEITGLRYASHAKKIK